MLKINLILISALLLCGSVNAQNDKLKKDTLVYFLRNPNPVDVLVYKSNPLIVNNRDSADFYRLIISPDNTDKDLYVVNDFYKNGKVKLIGKSRDKAAYINLQGMCIDYFINGHKKSITTFERGLLMGNTYKYYPNGKFYAKERYGRKDSVFLVDCSDSTGKVIAENGTGKWIQYDEEFKMVCGQGQVANGIKEGEWFGSAGDNIKYNIVYNHGKLIQGKSQDRDGKLYSFTEVVTMPDYKGGIKAFFDFLGKTIKYPVYAREHNITGKVLVTFYIEKDGSLTDLKIVKGLDGGIDEEALRSVSLSPKWIPSLLFGVPVRVPYTIPIQFSINTVY